MRNVKRNIKMKKKEGKRYYKPIKYPNIPLSSNDIHVITTIGDRLDSLAYQFYNDSSLWWVISSANPDIIRKDSYALKPGMEIRIPYDPGFAIRAFEVANKISTKRTTALQNQANAAGLSDESINILTKFKNVDEALQDVDGKRILNLAGSRAADRDAILPMLSNRRAWSQSNDPYLKSLFQFLSWAQAKTSQTNALISRMEDGDDALFVKMIGSLALYDGIVTFKSFLNDPSGEWLEERDEDSYKEAYATLKNIGAGVQHSGNFNHVLIDKIARLASSHGGQHPLENLVPVIGWGTEMFKSYAPPVGDFEGSISRNIRTGDFEGATKQALKPLPFGDEVLDVLDYAGYPIEDEVVREPTA